TNTGISGPGGSEEDSSFSPAISSNGRYVAFTSFNRHLVPDDTNEWNDVFRLELAVPVPATQAYQSIGTHDGWVIESGEDSNEGTRIDSGASTLFLGDANNDQQYRSILHFTTASLPNNAIITNVTLRVKRQSITGTNPSTTHGNLLVDIRKPYFGSAVDLQAVDFQAPADLQAAGILESSPGALWYTADLDPGSFPFVDRTGTTQFRLRFALDDDNDDEQDIIKFYSGDAASADQPVLTIDYFLPAGGSPSVTGIFRADANPTAAPTVRFTVAFSESVTGVDVSDFSLATSGAISGASIDSVSGSGDAYTITVGTGTGNGTLRLDLIDDNSILDANNIPLAGSGTENGSFYAGESYTVTKTIFGDVPESHWARSFIERLYKAGITGGCGIDPLMYCPEGTVTRAQMAVFLERGIHGSTYNPPSVGASTGFSDVPLTYWAASWIKQLAAEGITGGCGAGTYCPESPVTRAQMAIFLLRSKHGSGYNPPSVGGSTGFSDVPADHWAATWIKQLVAEGIATGCITGAYCPEAPVTRAQMAVFLVRTFSLP
ncbi:MAG TPA: S-layer homology domain-containing protein, partial [Anaerolineales bacterium]